MRPIKADLDKAISQPWSPTTCILAQCIIRHGLRVTNSAWWSALSEYQSLMAEFDKAFACSFGCNPDWKALRQLRDELPENEDVVEETKAPICPNLIPNTVNASLSGLPNPCECVELSKTTTMAPTQ